MGGRKKDWLKNFQKRYELSEAKILLITKPLREPILF